ncbi:MAG: iron ABC transporter permease [Rectinema sp.]|nr:iron ABC transporter permease [Rectinema sp.]
MNEPLSPPGGEYQRARSHRWLLLAGLAAFAALLSLIDSAVGSVRIPLSAIWQVLIGTPPREEWDTIIRIFRLPKLLTAILAGGGLASAGLILQSIFRNPLAGPDSLGIGAGASIGVALLMFTGSAAGSSATMIGSLPPLGYFMLVIAASLGAGAVLVLILLIARRFEQVVTVLIMGILVGYLASSVVSLLVYFGAPQKVQLYLAWTYGSFGGVTWKEIPWFAGAVIGGFVLALRDTKSLNAFLVGERFATTIGIRVRASRTRLLIAAAVLAGSATAFCGPIAFLGIAAPHAARLLTRSAEHRLLLPVSALTGICVALLADIISSLPGKGMLPVNPLLALIGAPLIMSLFLRRTES